MTSHKVRQQFLDFFKSKNHEIVPSAPIVTKNDPTLLFNNAGMNQFKDYFLGDLEPKSKRIADTQKCLRVSGKHNDLEEVGVDTYHHTMFEMLGNWSFGDYFKEETIQWAWELLTEIYKLDKSRLYVTVFEGYEGDGLPADIESETIWKKYIGAERILRCDRKDNFWEMGKTGPCGACSEIHYDLRPDAEREKTPGYQLVNKDHPQVIELWNLVFIEYNRKADNSLVHLPEKHVDTGMGFERLVRAILSENSNYNTDLFQDSIKKLENISGIKYGQDEQTDIAFRVVADHVRALSFSIADGQLPSNTGAGYVIRRILRRAVRYGYTFLNLKEPFMNQLVDGLAIKFEQIFPEVTKQSNFISKVIKEEESSFFNTLTHGLNKLDTYLSSSKTKTIDGRFAFELFDTYGFPVDLTQLIALENNKKVNLEEFNLELAKQKKRSKQDAVKNVGDWVIVREDDVEEFVGYSRTEAKVIITRYRQVENKGKMIVHLVFNYTPFFAESGGQVGDTGVLIGEDEEKIPIIDTQKDNNLIVHVTKKVPSSIKQSFKAIVNKQDRQDITANHSATHLMHSALKNVLGNHVAQKGSLVNNKHLRFDFSHFAKLEDDQIHEVERIVNDKIREAIPLTEQRNVPYDEAIKGGVTALFGEKYGDVVRVISFDKTFSSELCGGTHTKNTANIGLFKIVSESSVAAGVRRIEAITSYSADRYVQQKIDNLVGIENALGNPKDSTLAVNNLLLEQKELKKKIEYFENEIANQLKGSLSSRVQCKDGVNLIIEEVKANTTGQLKDIAFQLNNEITDLFLVLAADVNGKPNITVIIGNELVKLKNLHAGNLVREWAKNIKGGGGGQPFFAQAGGKEVDGLKQVIEAANSYCKEL